MTLATLIARLWVVVLFAVIALPCARPCATMIWHELWHEPPPPSSVFIIWLFLTLLTSSAVLL